MGNEVKDDGISRRGFLKSVVATAALATAAGTGAAVLLDKTKTTTITTIPNVTTYIPPVSSLPAVANPAAANQTLAQLAAIQAENMQLRAALDAAERRVTALTQAQGSDPAFDILQGQLTEANDRATILSGLVTLYEQLEAVDMETVVAAGLAAVGGPLTGLLDRIPTVQEGLAAGQQALAEFEVEIPLMDNGRRWLASHLQKVSGFYQLVENVLREVVETAGSFLENLGQWFQDVLRWLPFGMGDNAARIVEALTNLLAETPNTINGLHTNLVQPLDVWLDGDGDNMPLRRRLVKPIREQALQPAGETLSQAQAIQSTYQAQLVEPTQAAASSRQTIRAVISQYRQQHQV
jgi:hypothetical protein